LLFKQGRLNEAEKLALELPEAENAIYGKPANIELYSLLSNIYQEKKNFQKAYHYRIIHQELLNKFLHNPQALKAAQMIRSNLEEEKRLAAILERENEKHVQNLYLLLIAGGLITVLLVLGLVYRNNIRQKKNYRKLDAQRKQIQSTLESLRSTQAQLVHSEKMASLGELTAGIAHEIQNPLNFVNNFSEVNTELVDEASHEINKGNLSEAKTILNDIRENEHKINYHGKRADAIVKSMLQHSRSSSGKKEPTDINALIDEYLRLAYQGLRAKDKSFNAKCETDFDDSIGKINIISQDIGRVVLNLINNAFYAVDEKRKAPQSPKGGVEYEPTVSVSTKKDNGKIEIKVADNGNGIPQKVLDKIFQPFFTTKPTGQGTGLGLSLAYDIVKAHGGEITVNTNVSEYTEFILRLPS
jgi:signal transduction histidine kinase